MPQTTQQLIARQEALKRAMAANPKNKATQKLGASALASTNSKLSSVKSKVEQVQKYKNASKPASSNSSQTNNRAQYLLNFGQTKQTPVNTVNGMPSSNQLVRAEDQSAKAQIKQISEGFNVVYDPVTGKNYSPNSAKGKELLASSGLNYKDYLKGIKTSGTGSVENVATYAELGADMLNKDLADTASVEKEIFGESGAPTTLDEYKQMQKESIARKYSEANRSLDYQRQASEDQFMDSRRGVATSGEVLAGQLASGQEGVVSNSATLDRMRALTKERQQRLAAEFQDLDAKISSARADLKEAYAANKTALAQDIQSKLNAYEMEAKRIDTELSNALTQQLGAESDYASTQSAIKQSGLTLFQNVVAQGQPMDYSVIRGYAEQLGLPVEMLMGYYENNQQIRDDKTLDLAAKEQLYRQNEQNLQDQMTGMDTEAAKNTKAYISLVQMGASQDVLDSFKKAAGLRIDPFEQVKGEAMMLENEILQYQVDNLGQPPPEGSPERVDYDLKMLELSAKKKELRDMYGYKDITLDEAKSIFFVDGKSAFHQNDPAWGDGTNQWECGEGYRKITDYPNPVGNTYAEKFSKVTKGLETPQIGFGLVLPLGDSGHLETVISNPDPVTGTFQTLSWNRNGKGGMTIENYNINDLNAKYGDGWGFIESSLKPEFAEKLASAGLGGENSPILTTLDEKTIDNVRSEAGAFRQEPIVKDYNTIANKALSVQSIIDAGVGGAGDLVLVFEFMKALDPSSVVRETEYANAAASGNIFAGAFAKFNGYLKEEGGFLPDNLKTAFRDLINVKMEASEQQYQNLYNEYVARVNSLAGGKNVAPEILTDYSKIFQGGSDQEAADQQLQDWMDLYDNSNILNEFDSVWGQ